MNGLLRGEKVHVGSTDLAVVGGLEAAVHPLGGPAEGLERVVVGRAGVVPEEAVEASLLITKYQKVQAQPLARVPTRKESCRGQALEWRCGAAEAAAEVNCRGCRCGCGCG